MNVCFLVTGQITKWAPRVTKWATRITKRAPRITKRATQITKHVVRITKWVTYITEISHSVLFRFNFRPYYVYFLVRSGSLNLNINSAGSVKQKLSNGNAFVALCADRVLLTAFSSCVLFCWENDNPSWFCSKLKNVNFRLICLIRIAKKKIQTLQPKTIEDRNQRKKKR